VLTKEDIAGTWVQDIVSRASTIHRRQILTLDVNNRVSLRYIEYENKISDSTYTTQFTGNFRTNGKKLYFTTETYSSWSMVEGWRTGIYRADMFENCQYERRGDTLLIDYYTRPADAPVLTHAVFTRL
jgi:hypothetical protein